MNGNFQNEGTQAIFALLALTNRTANLPDLSGKDKLNRQTR
jgi:hypothetical protein